MAEKKNQQSASPPESIPSGQRLFDNMFLWLVLSFLISGVLYNIWGLIEIFNIPALVK